MRTLLPIPLALAIVTVALGVHPALADDAKPAPKAEDAVVGTWFIETEAFGGTHSSTMVIVRAEDGSLKGTYRDAGRDPISLRDLAFEDGKLRFQRSAGRRTIGFEGTIKDGVLKGKHQGRGMVFPASGVRGRKALDKLMAERRKANERGTDLEADYDKFSRRVVKRDAFPVLTNPKMVAAKDAAEIRDREPVLGVTIGDEARAYPISIMGVHELVNDTMGGVAYAASW